MTAAEKSKSYRERKKARGEKTSRGKSKDNSKWANAHFIALDGEGESAGKKELFAVGADKKHYFAADHRYTLLAASTGENLYRSGKRLETQECIDFLIDLGASYQKSIFVIFAGGYDINHMLMFGFDRDVLKKISKGDEYQYQLNDVWYSIEFRARKSLTLRRHKVFFHAKDGSIKSTWKEKIIVWDVFGFFQENFVGVMRKWLGPDHKHFDLIQDMKKRRGDFANVAQSKINAYNAAELESLVEIMQKVHGAISGLDLKVQRWDGAGSIAAAMFRKHGIKENKSHDFSESVKFACRCAYAGGRIEICKVGFHDGPVYDYDINSAYPSVMKNLPCLAHGAWVHGTGEPPTGFTLVRVKYDFVHDLPFYPLWFRTKAMQISFPNEGEGWYWYPEYEQALNVPGLCEALEYYHFKPSCNHKPFQWIEGYYETRKKWTKKPDQEWQKGGEKIIKLGLNSLYGKCAQQLGGTDTEPPTYHQLEWAGYITSHTRANLFKLARVNPSAIIGFATDGVFSTKPLMAEKNTDKKLGAWELKQPIPEGITMVMAGVYWWHKGKNTFDHFSRGFDKDAMKTPHKILSAWAQGMSELEIPMHRLIGMGTACTSDELFKMRGRFAEGMRLLKLTGDSHKRHGCDVKKDKPHKKLVDLVPRANAEYGYGCQDISYPYPLKWACSTGEKDAFDNDLEIAAESDDTLNI